MDNLKSVPQNSDDEPTSDVHEIQGVNPDELREEAGRNSQLDQAHAEEQHPEEEAENKPKKRVKNEEAE